MISSLTIIIEHSPQTAEEPDPAPRSRILPHKAANRPPTPPHKRPFKQQGAAPHPEEEEAGNPEVESKEPDDQAGVEGGPHFPGRGAQPPRPEHPVLPDQALRDTGQGFLLIIAF